MKIKRPEAIGGSRSFLASQARMAPGKDYDYVQHFNPEKCLGPGPQFFPALTELPVLNANEAGHMRDGDYVVGLTMGSLPRAYPWWILDNSHAYNDLIDKVPLLVIL
ncbi:MAG: hypothetical protein ACE5IP_03675 [Terriglobia bacterium]